MDFVATRFVLGHSGEAPPLIPLATTLEELGHLRRFCHRIPRPASGNRLRTKNSIIESKKKPKPIRRLTELGIEGGAAAEARLD
jgi:hypothetical protein